MSRPIIIDLHCPCCEKMFESYQLEGSAAILYQTTDFYQCSEGTQPISYLIHTCPECGYTGYKPDFNGHRIDEHLKHQIKLHLYPLVNGKQSFSGNQYEYAAMIAKWKGELNYKIGDLYLRAAWCYQTAKSREGEKNCRLKAITFFELGLNVDEEPTKRAFYSFLVGELYRRIGNTKASMKWFEEAIDMSGDSIDCDWIRELAEQQKSDPKEVIASNTGSYHRAFALL